MIFVSDTSAVTALIQIRRIELLARLHERLIITTAVETELRRAHPVLPAFIEVVSVVNRSLPDRFAAELDAGESEAIALMLEGCGDPLLKDERKGRRVARREGLQVIGRPRSRRAGDLPLCEAPEVSKGLPRLAPPKAATPLTLRDRSPSPGGRIQPFGGSAAL